MALQLLLQVILIFCNAIFACAEIAVISINDTKLDRLAAGGDKRAKRLKKLTSEPARFLATIQVAITLSGFIGSAFAADNFSEPLAAWAVKIGIPISESVMKSIAVVVITLILSYFTLIFGELVPKRLAMKKAEPLALGISGFITLIAKIFAPIVWLLNASTNGVLRLLRINPEDEDDGVTEEEILMMSDAGAEKGTIDEEDNRIIKNIFAFDDMSAGQICTHRTYIDFLSVEDSDEAWREAIDASQHSLLPVCEESPDNIVGILDVRKYYRLSDRSRDNVMVNAVREPYFVHEGMKADVLFDNMKRRDAAHFAVVTDEYGGVCGIITITDLIEQLLGDFTENSVGMDDGIEKTADGEWTASGITPLADVAEAMGVSLPTGKFETLGGYIMSFADAFPQDGDTAVIKTDVIEAVLTDINNHRIEKCRLKVLSDRQGA